VNIQINFTKECDVRLDFKVVKFDTQEKQQFLNNLSNGKAYHAFNSHEFISFDK